MDHEWETVKDKAGKSHPLLHQRNVTLRSSRAMRHTAFDAHMKTHLLANLTHQVRESIRIQDECANDIKPTASLPEPLLAGILSSESYLDFTLRVSGGAL